MKTIINASFIKPKFFLIIAFVFMFIYDYAQSIPRDTNAVEFLSALGENDTIPKNFTGYVRHRNKPAIPGQSYRSSFYKKRSDDALDIIKLNYNLMSREKNYYKVGQTVRFNWYQNGRYRGKFLFHDNGKIQRASYIFDLSLNQGNTNRSLNQKSKIGIIKTIRTEFFSNIDMDFFKNGTIKQLTYPIDANDSYNYEGYSLKQNLEFKYTKVRGNYEGIITTYHENGKIHMIGMANRDLINGYVLNYSEGGEIDSVKFYKKNIYFPNIDSSQFQSQFIILKLIAEESNRSVDRKKELADNIESLKKTEEQKKLKEEELKYQEQENKRKQLELEILSKDKVVSDLTIKAKEAELVKSTLLANEKRKEIESLNQLQLISELSIKNKEAEIKRKNIEAENKQKQIQGLEVEKTLSEENRKQQAFIQKMILSGLVMLAVFLFFVFVNLRKTRKANKIIALQKTEVEKQKEVVDLQNHLIKEKQKEILDSIHYAKRLQEAILPPLHFINEHVPNNFVLYQPKDVVAGDFYWAEIKEDKFFIAAADSTGHGVPGAMVSVVCSNALNRTVNEFGITDTGKILDKTRELVLETFAKGNSEVKDGMDISLLCIDKSNNKVYWSGANNPLWYVKSSVTSSAVEKSTDAGLDSARPDIQLIEIKADKQPIGKTEITKPFTTHEIALQDGMQFYLFTDGFADQFGGPKGKKFMYKQLENLLLSISHESMEIQKQKLENVFKNWKGDLEQVDDVCMIGVRV